MPINLALKLKSISDHEFADIDEVVMKCAYASQNYFGRLFDERVYENDLAARLRAEGLAVHTQVPIVLCHAGFEKRYSMDLVVNDMLYELKAVDALTGEHDVQALNYAMLQNIRLVKVINFGEAKIRGKLLRNAVVDGGRNHATCNRCEFVPLGRQCERLLKHLNNLLCDWGTHLSCRLYNEALVHEFGGDLNCLQRVELSAHGQHLGTHVVQLYDANRAFTVTGFTCPQAGYEKHLQVLLRHTPRLEAVQWFNLNNSCVEARTVERK